MKKLKTMLHAARARLGGRAGETLAETLFALLISALAILMLATMITTSADMIHRSTDAFDAYYAANNGLSTHTVVDHVTKSADVTAALRTGTPDKYDTTDSVAVYLVDSANVTVTCYANGKAPDGTPVVSYE